MSAPNNINEEEEEEDEQDRFDYNLDNIQDMNRNSTKMLRVDADSNNNSFIESGQKSDTTQIKRIDTFGNSMDDSTNSVFFTRSLQDYQ